MTMIWCATCYAAIAGIYSLVTVINPKMLARLRDFSLRYVKNIYITHCLCLFTLSQHKRKFTFFFSLKKRVIILWKMKVSRLELYKGRKLGLYQNDNNLSYFRISLCKEDKWIYRKEKKISKNVNLLNGYSLFKCKNL